MLHYIKSKLPVDFVIVFFNHSASALFLLAAFMLIVATVIIFRKGQRDLRRILKSGHDAELRAQEMLDELCISDRLDNIVIGDINNPKSMAEIDHLIPGNNRYIIIEGKSWNGEISGTANDEYWTLKTRNHGTVTRRNPIWQVGRHARILSKTISLQSFEETSRNEKDANGLLKVIPEIPVYPVVLMAGHNTFLDGIPHGVVLYKDRNRITDIVAAYSGVPCEHRLEKSWNALVEENYSDHGKKREALYMKYVTRNRQKFPIWVRVLTLGIGFAVVGLLNILVFSG